MKKDEELVGIVNSGHSRAAAFVLRTVGDDFEPRKFSTWMPMAIALIGKVWDTLADRSIEIVMVRRRKTEKVERFRDSRPDPDLVRLRRMAARWTEDHADDVAAWDGEVPEALHDRAADNWRPLLAIADLAGGHWPQRAREAAVALTHADADDQSTMGILLLADLKEEIFPKTKEPDEEKPAAAAAGLFSKPKEPDAPNRQLRTKTILKALHDLPERPWVAWGKHERPITDRQLAGLLKPFGIRSGTFWFGTGDAKAQAKGYQEVDFRDVWDRYIPISAPAPVPPTEASQRNNADISRTYPTSSSVMHPSRDVTSAVTEGGTRR
jgi:putative DNA primase/helicase